MELTDPIQMALVLTFDPPTQTRLDQLIAGLEGLGIKPFPEGMQVPAHITLTAFTPQTSSPGGEENSASSSVPPLVLLENLQMLAAETEPIEVRFDSLSAFNSSQGVIFLAPVITRRLQELHVRALETLAAYHPDFNPYYLPDQWVPHVTLAVEQPPEAMPVIFKACQRAGAFTTGLAEAIQLVEFPPPRRVAAFHLGDGKALNLDQAAL